MIRGQKDIYSYTKNLLTDGCSQALRSKSTKTSSDNISSKKFFKLDR